MMGQSSAVVLLHLRRLDSFLRRHRFHSTAHTQASTILPSCAPSSIMRCSITLPAAAMRAVAPPSRSIPGFLMTPSATSSPRWRSGMTSTAPWHRHKPGHLLTGTTSSSQLWRNCTSCFICILTSNAACGCCVGLGDIIRGKESTANQHMNSLISFSRKGFPLLRQKNHSGDSGLPNVSIVQPTLTTNDAKSLGITSSVAPTKVLQPSLQSEARTAGMSASVASTGVKRTRCHDDSCTEDAHQALDST